MVLSALLISIGVTALLACGRMESVATMFGRDLTFTGRTEIWSYVVDAINERPVLGYRANVLAYFMAGERPVVALFDILNGWVRGGVPAALTLRQLLRCFLPRTAYRRLVDAIILIRRDRSPQ